MWRVCRYREWRASCGAGGGGAAAAAGGAASARVRTGYPFCLRQHRSLNSVCYQVHSWVFSGAM